MELNRVFCFLFFLMTTGFMSISEAYNFYVGGKDGWVLHPSEDYDHWAQRNRFQVNDSLIFKVKEGSDSVLLVSKDDYYKCNKENPIKKMSNGESVFKLERSGPFFFISGNKNGACEKGQKLILIVLAVRHHNKPSVSAPTPAPQKAMPPVWAPTHAPKGMHPVLAPTLAPKGMHPISAPTSAPKGMHPVLAPSFSPEKGMHPILAPAPAPQTGMPPVSTPSPTLAPGPSVKPMSPSPLSAPSVAPGPSASDISPTGDEEGPAPAPKTSSARGVLGVTPSVFLVAAITLVLSVTF